MNDKPHVKLEAAALREDTFNEDEEEAMEVEVDIATYDNYGDESYYGGEEEVNLAEEPDQPEDEENDVFVDDADEGQLFNCQFCQQIFVGPQASADHAHSCHLIPGRRICLLPVFIYLFIFFSKCIFVLLLIFSE